MKQYCLDFTLGYEKITNSNNFFIQMFEVRQIISVFSKIRLERKKFGNHCFREIHREI